MKTPTRIYKDIDMKLTKNFISGDITKKYDIAAIRQSIRNIIYTRVNERPFDPTWGSRIHELLFEPIDGSTTNAIQLIVRQAIENNEPRVSIERIQVTAVPDDNSYNVYVYFYAVGIKDLQEMDIVLSRLR